MVHAVSTTYLRFEHMSPPAAGLALLLHASVALALYLVSPLKFSEAAPPEPIEVTMESPLQQNSPPVPDKAQEQAAATPATPQAPPPAAAPPRPAGQTTNVPLGMIREDAKTADKPVDAPAPPKPAEPPQETAAAPKDTPETTGKPLPEVSAPAAPLSMQDFVRIAPPPPPQEVLHPAPRTPAPPPPQRQQLPQSPLTAHQQHETPQTSPRGMVNPAEQAARVRVMDEYQRAAILKFSRYLPNLREKNEGGTVVVKFIIGRDGRLLDATIVQSSGVMALDKGMLDAIKAASPYPPLPPEFPGDRATLTQSFTARM